MCAWSARVVLGSAQCLCVPAQLVNPQAWLGHCLLGPSMATKRKCAGRQAWSCKKVEMAEEFPPGPSTVHEL
eukprot:12269148-Alexandrium_andersonii.AAC.1